MVVGKYILMQDILTSQTMWCACNTYLHAIFVITEIDADRAIEYVGLVVNLLTNLPDAILDEFN